MDIWRVAAIGSNLQRLALALGLVSAGCEVVGGYERFERQTAKTPHRCDGLPATKPSKTGLLMLTKVTGGSCFWIDQTEVTVAQYRQYLADPDAPNVEDSASCEWKTAPTDLWHASDDACLESMMTEDLPLAEGKPIRCVDWCDAATFCKWAGKSLCDGDPLTGVDTAGRELSWSSACSDGGLPYPYGGTKVIQQACNIGLRQFDCANLLGTNVCGPTFVPSSAPLHCESPNGAVDMVGNVAEWAAGCGKTPAASKAQLCQTKGGSFADDDSVNCQTRSRYKERATRDRSIGFRCCASLSIAELAMLSNGE